MWFWLLRALLLCLLCGSLLNGKTWNLNTLCRVFLLYLASFIRAVRVAPFSNRLAHAVPAHIQGLRCLANFEALRFAEPIRLLAEKMVDRMVTKSVESGGKYVSVHLRFEMVYNYSCQFLHFCNSLFVVPSYNLYLLFF